jgi:hypothetical protein
LSTNNRKILKGIYDRKRYAFEQVQKFIEYANEIKTIIMTEVKDTDAADAYCREKH